MSAESSFTEIDFISVRPTDNRWHRSLFLGNYLLKGITYLPQVRDNDPTRRCAEERHTCTCQTYLLSGVHPPPEWYMEAFEIPENATPTVFLGCDAVRGGEASSEFMWNNPGSIRIRLFIASKSDLTSYFPLQRSENNVTSNKLQTVSTWNIRISNIWVEFKFIASAFRSFASIQSRSISSRCNNMSVLENSYKNFIRFRFPLLKWNIFLW